MKIDTELLSHYLKQQPCPSTYDWVYTFTNGVKEIEMHRQDVVQALLQQLLLYQEQGYPLWNTTMHETIFQEELQTANEITILPIVGASANFDCTLCHHACTTYLLIDVLNIADYTHILSQMYYILHNLIHVHTCSYLIQQHYAKKPISYLQQIENMFFVNGLAQYVSWNEQMEQKGLQNSVSNQYREKAFSLLYQAMQVQDEATQQLILKQIKEASFWNQFPQIAGMFFLDDLYHAQHMQGLRAFYKHGPNAILSIVFQE